MTANSLLEKDMTQHRDSTTTVSSDWAPTRTSISLVPRLFQEKMKTIHPRYALSFALLTIHLEGLGTRLNIMNINMVPLTILPQLLFGLHNTWIILGWDLLHIGLRL